LVTCDNRLNSNLISEADERRIEILLPHKMKNNIGNGKIIEKTKKVGMIQSVRKIKNKKMKQDKILFLKLK